MTLAIDTQLQTFVFDMRSNEMFVRLKGIGDLARKIVETKKKRKKKEVYPRVQLLITLALILLVAIATVERVVSVLNFVKNRV